MDIAQALAPTRAATTGDSGRPATGERSAAASMTDILFDLTALAAPAAAPAPVSVDAVDGLSTSLATPPVGEALATTVTGTAPPVEDSALPLPVSDAGVTALTTIDSTSTSDRLPLSLDALAGMDRAARQGLNAKAFVAPKPVEWTLTTQKMSLAATFIADLIRKTPASDGTDTSGGTVPVDKPKPAPDVVIDPTLMTMLLPLPQPTPVTPPIEPRETPPTSTTAPEAEVAPDSAPDSGRILVFPKIPTPAMAGRLARQQAERSSDPAVVFVPEDELQPPPVAHPAPEQIPTASSLMQVLVDEAPVVQGPPNEEPVTKGSLTKEPMTQQLLTEGAVATGADIQAPAMLGPLTGLHVAPSHVTSTPLEPVTLTAEPAPARAELGNFVDATAPSGQGQASLAPPSFSTVSAPIKAPSPAPDGRVAATEMPPPAPTFAFLPGAALNEMTQEPSAADSPDPQNWDPAIQNTQTSDTPDAAVPDLTNFVVPPSAALIETALVHVDGRPSDGLQAASPILVAEPKADAAPLSSPPAFPQPNAPVPLASVAPDPRIWENETRARADMTAPPVVVEPNVPAPLDSVTPDPRIWGNETLTRTDNPAAFIATHQDNAHRRPAPEPRPNRLAVSEAVALPEQTASVRVQIQPDMPTAGAPRDAGPRRAPDQANETTVLVSSPAPIFAAVTDPVTTAPAPRHEHADVASTDPQPVLLRDREAVTANGQDPAKGGSPDQSGGHDSQDHRQTGQEHRAPHHPHSETTGTASSLSLSTSVAATAGPNDDAEKANAASDGPIGLSVVTGSAQADPLPDRMVTSAIAPSPIDSGLPSTWDASPSSGSTVSGAILPLAQPGRGMIDAGQSPNGAGRLPADSETLIFQRDRAIEKQVIAALKQGQSTVRVSLYPPQLGQVTINMALDGLKVRVGVKTGSREATATLTASRATLAEALGHEGFTLEGFDVGEDATGQEAERGNRGRETSATLIHTEGSADVAPFSIDITI